MPVNNKTIAKNTMMLYVRMFLVIAIQLYTVPVILRVLGVEDYGIYNVVAGVVTMFTFVNGSLASGTQRFFAYAIGQKDDEELRRVFNANITVYGLFSIVSIFILEGFCVWFLNYKMNIPSNRLWVANWVLQLSILQFVINLMTTTYNASIIAHEKMSIYAYFSILDCVLKLVVVFMLQVSPWDMLLTYAILQTLLVMIMQFLNQFYCAYNFIECRHYRFNWDKPLIKSLMSYASFNVIGSLAGLLCGYGVNIIQNLFFGPILNAAHAISQQISGIINQFTFNVRMAVRPQVVKSYAANEIEAMWTLVHQSGKLTFFLFIFMSIPLLIELPYILDLWLDTVPDNTVAICRISILTILITTLTAPLNAVYQAANKLKHVQLYSAGIILFSVPVSYLILLIYKNVLVCYITNITLNFIASVATILIAKYDLNMSISRFINQAILPCCICFVLPLFIVLFIIQYFEPSFIRLVITCVSSLFISSVFMWNVGISTQEKEIVIRYTSKFFKKN